MTTTTTTKRHVDQCFKHVLVPTLHYYLLMRIQIKIMNFNELGGFFNPGVHRISKLQISIKGGEWASAPE